MQVDNVTAGYALSTPIQETKYACGGKRFAQHKHYPNTIAAGNFVQVILPTFCLL